MKLCKVQGLGHTVTLKGPFIERARRRAFAFRKVVCRDSAKLLLHPPNPKPGTLNCLIRFMIQYHGVLYCTEL